MKKLLLLVLAAILAAGAVFTWRLRTNGNRLTDDLVSYYPISAGERQKQRTPETAPTASPAPTPALTPTPSPTPSPTPEPTPEPIPTISPEAVQLWHERLDFPWEEEPPLSRDGKMAYNIYADPVLPESRGFTGFLVDFKADYDPIGTYWSLCNWRMDLTEFRKYYTVSMDAEAEYGAYAGLQRTENGTAALLSFWDLEFLDPQGQRYILRAKCTFPQGTYNVFGGEGDGSNYIADYAWQPGRWYRMYLGCGRSVSGGTTVSMWVKDIGLDEWTWISSFNTGLPDSFFIGSFSQFLENYQPEYSNAPRSMEIRNMYVRDCDTGEWYPITEAQMSADTDSADKTGGYAFGAAAMTFWGITSGEGVTAEGQEASGDYEILAGLMEGADAPVLHCDPMDREPIDRSAFR